jgi:hypothetical protein
MLKDYLLTILMSAVMLILPSVGLCADSDMEFTQGAQTIGTKFERLMRSDGNKLKRLDYAFCRKRP